MEGIDGYTPDMEAGVYAVGDIAVIINEQGQVIRASESVQTILGIPAHEVLGQQLQQVVVDQDSLEMFNFLVANPATEPAEAALIQLNGLTPDGEEDIRYFDTYSFLASQDPGAIAIIFRDATERILARNLQVILAHDLGGILAILQLKIDSVIERRKMDADKIRDELANLQKALAHARDLHVKLAANLSMPGVARLVPVEGAEIYKTIETMRSVVQTDGFKILVDPFDADAWQTVMANQQMVASIIYGLMSNAVKFADKGRLREGTAQLRIGLAEKQEPQFVTIVVQDNGIGMGPNRLSDLFKFGKSSSSGNGLSLWWIRRELKKIGGSIKVVSEKDVGTTFFVQLPLDDGKHKNVK